MIGFKTKQVLPWSIGLIMAFHLTAVHTQAQQLPRPSVWVSGDFLPYSKFNDAPFTQLDESEVQTMAISGGISLPFVFADGRTLFMVDATYRQRPARNRET